MIRKIKFWIFKQCYLQSLRDNSDEVVRRYLRRKVNKYERTTKI